MSTYKRRKRFSAKMAKALLVILCVQTFFPTSLLALTSGPSQPEFSEFEPVGTTQMVDLFSGDFVYNIPLFELPGPDGGYPFNLSYHSGVTMDQEATWVGLGWTLNHGAITRTMRGFPDDFNGEEVERKMHMEDNRTWRFGLSAHKEFLGFDLGKDLPGKLGASLGLKASFNNYRGVGLSTSFGLSARFIENDENGKFVKTKSKANFGLSFGSEDGANLTGGLSLGTVESKNRASLSFSKNGREGVQSLSLGYTRNITQDKIYTRGKGDKKKSYSGTTTTSPTANYTYTKSSYSPQVSMPYRGMHFTGSVEGGAYPGIFLGIGGEFEVSFNRQKVKNNNRWTKAPAYGYFHLRTDVNKGLSDFNREKDGRIYEKTPNLANPITTPDIYSVTGQGTGGSYRAYRSDVGTLSDPKMTSLTGGGTLGIDINALAGVDGGADIGGNFAISSNRRWSGPNLFKFDSETMASKDYEPFYFKAAGEMTAEEVGTYDYIGGEQALKLGLKIPFGKIETPDWNRAQGNGLVLGTNSTNSSLLGDSPGRRGDRKPRSNSIQYITNGQLLGPNGEESLNEYEVDYYSLDNNGNIDFNNATALERSIDKPDQFAGMTALQPNGMRYVYGLPVMNKEHHEVSFSAPANENGPVDCSEMDLTTTNYSTNGAGDEVITPTEFEASGNYLNHTKMPEYAHSYLLTSVLGADYVDLGEPGPSDEDYGYWVKFNYVKTTTDLDPYIWKTPFIGANFIAGSFADRADDKGMIVAGTREQYYLASAETRTHYAEFEIDMRTDARGAAQLFQDDNGQEAHSYKLKSVKLFSKLEKEINPNATPIKTVVFKYAGEPSVDGPELCNGVDNGEGGKLTLKSVHFEYENSERGRLSPYQFTYANNPDYNPLSFDRWGTYKGGMTNCEKFNEPYSEQNKGTADNNARAWSLSKIDLPSGASISVIYESDDYAYVQDEVAMQMFTLTGGGDVETKKNPTDDDRTIFFELEEGENDIDQYMNGLHGVTENGDGTLNYANAQLYFKIKANLNNSDSEDYVKGYARIKSATIAGTQGKIVLEPVDLNGRDYHPFAAAAWQHLKAVYPQGAMDGVDLDNANENNFKDALSDLGAAFGQIKAVFSNFYAYCSSESFGDRIVPDESFVRLCSPDRMKMGGGCRVKQITLADNWDIGEDNDEGLEDDVNTYGQYFEYTDDIKDENGDIIKTISSGVAMNEPAIGYDECALRYAKIWNNRSSLLASDEKVIFEYPINESYYPGASVGYSKVTVKSLATHYAMEGVEPDLPDGYGTTGVTVNEFYTAKDFPVITKETVLSKFLNDFKQLYGLVNLTTDLFAASQGYTITLNDMHGKPHKVTHYGLDNQNEIIDQKLSEVVYTYSEGEAEVNDTGGRRKTVRTLNNVVPVLKSLYSGAVADADVEDQLLGVDYETFLDMRESWSTGAEGSVGLNAKYTPPFIFGFAGWPRMTLNYSTTRTAVVNKVIRKSGILTKTDAYDGQSHITTSNEVFDRLTGEPLLTTVNNSFDDKIYNYNIPARLAYDRMGAAYENWGTKFSGVLGIDEDCGYFTFTNVMGELADLIRGDEIIMTGFMDESTACEDYAGLCDHRKFTFVGMQNNKYLFENSTIGDVSLGAHINMMVIRSGNRNHLSAKSGNIAALSNPLENRDVFLTDNLNLPKPGNGGDAAISSRYTRIDNVLNASAVSYRDAWDLEREVEEESITVTYPPSGSGCQCIKATIEYDPNNVPDCNMMIVFSATGGEVDNNSAYIMNPLRPYNEWPETDNGNDGFLVEQVFCSETGFDGMPEAYLMPIDGTVPFEDQVENPACAGIEYDVTVVPFQNCDRTCNCAGGYPDFTTEPSCTWNVRLNGYAFNLSQAPFNGYSLTSTPGDLTDEICDQNGSGTCLQLICSPQNIDPFSGITGVPSGCVSNITVASIDDCSGTADGSSNGGSTFTLTKATSDYNIGTRGIWRPHKSYTYVEERTPNNLVANNGEVNIQNEGVFDDLTLFDWTNPFFPQLPVASNWKQTNEITKYSRNGEEVENRDIIGLYSSAKYGYKDNLPIAVSANAAYHEIGFESFEEHPEGLLADIEYESTGGFNFQCGDIQKTISFSYNVLGAYIGGASTIWIDKEAYNGMPIPDNAFLLLKDKDGKEYEAATGVSGMTPFDPDSELLQTYFRGDVCSVGLVDIQSCELPDDKILTGRVVLQYNIDYQSIPGDLFGCGAGRAVTTEAAHTGTKSLKVPRITSFLQEEVQLMSNRNYVISAWVKSASTQQVYSYEGTGTSIQIDNNNSLIFKPKGAIIDGWQRIEGVFSLNDGDPWSIELIAGGGTFYFDDIRIYPEDGSIQTYVYNPEDYRLQAVLDQNNYATFYRYDEEGNLFLIKKETARGIKTIQETREYVKDTREQ